MALFPDPFDTLSSLQQALDSFRSSSWLAAGPSGGGTYPPMNVFRKGDDLVIIAEVPGVKKSDLDVQVKGNTIRLAGTKAVNYPEKSQPASPRAARRPFCPRHDVASRDQPGRREGRMPRWDLGLVPAARRARQAEVDRGGVT